MRGLVNRYELTSFPAAGSSAVPEHNTSIPGVPTKQLETKKERALDKVSGFLSLIISTGQSMFVMEFSLNFIVNIYNTSQLWAKRSTPVQSAVPRLFATIS